MGYIVHNGHRLWEVKRRKDLRVGDCLIYPSAAEDFVENTIHVGNVVRSADRVAEFEGKLRHGEIVMGFDSIGFTPDGLLQNGVHRMTACRNTGIPFPCHVLIRDRSAFAVTDIRGRRSLAQQYKIMHGLKNACSVVAVCKWMWKYRNRAMSDVQDRQIGDSPEFLDLCRSFEDKAEQFVWQWRKSFLSRVIANSIGVSMFCVASLIDERASDDFMVGLVDNTFRPGSPLHALRLKFETLEKNNVNTVRLARVAALVQAMNAEKEGATMKRIVVPAPGSITSANFPVLWGVQPEDLPF